MTATILEGLGYTVLTASSAEEAIHLAGLHAGNIHLLLTDIIMPHMTGLDLAKHLQTTCPALPCLFMSGYTADVTALAVALEKENEFIQKPFTVRDLAIRVRHALDKGF